MDPLFPDLPSPEELAALSDEDVQALLEEHTAALEKVEKNDPEYIGTLSAEEVIAELERGVEQIKSLRNELQAREDAKVAYEQRVQELAAEARGQEEEIVAESEGEGDDDGDGEEEGEGAEGEAEGEEAEAEGDSEEVEAEEREPVLVASQARRMPVRMVRPPAPARDRQAPESPRVQVLTAAGAPGLVPGTPLDRLGFAKACMDVAKRLGKPSKHENGTEERYLVATAEFPFEEERSLKMNDPDGNTAKLRAIGSPWLGSDAMDVLLASGGLCAPLTPFYDIPDFAVRDRPVRDALPSFNAERGGVSVPTVSTIGAITTAITVIEEEEDALGGTFATKSCQDFTCPTWEDVAVGIISHCREYGNLNARAWPEGIAHENNLTLAAHARTAETRLLDRIKTLSINVTTASVYSATFDFVYAIVRAAEGIRWRLRLGDTPMLRALIPQWVPGMLVADNAAMNVPDRNKTRAQVVQILRDAGIEPAFYKDPVTGGTSQAFADEAAGALDNFPSVVQWALFVEGEFLHLDGGVLELGVVRDSTLNITNDYQVFGETFENVARIGPTQGALWVSSTVCPDGTFPALQTALTC
jgi:hypothetical protein